MVRVSRAHRRSILLGTVGVMTFCLPSAGFAQDAANVQLRTIDVEGVATQSTAVSPVVGYVPERTSAGSKTDTPISEIPQSVSVIGREQIRDLGADKADEALRYTAGVFSQMFGPDSDTNWMMIRGFEATQTGIYQDGLQLYGYGFGGFYVDSYSLERIEVLRGAASVLYGGSNPGGLINYVSKRPGGRIRNAEIGVTGTGKSFLGFDIGDAISDVLDYRVTGRIEGGRGYTDFEKGFRGFISPSLTWRPNNQTSLTVLANYTHIDQIHNGGAFLPYIGTVVDAPFGRISRKANFTEPGIDTYNREQASIGYEFAHTFENNWTVKQNFRAGYMDLHEIAPYAYGYAGFSPAPVDANNSLERINFEHRTKVTTVLLDNQLQGKVNVGGFEHSLLFGVDYKLYDMDQVQSTGAATTISANNPIYGAIQGVRTPYINQLLTQQQVGLYVQDQIRFGDGWIVTLNGRHDRVTTEAKGLPMFDGSAGAWSGRGGVAYKFANGMTPYASVSTFFNPLIGTISTDFLKPEEGQQYEVGLKYQPLGYNALFTMAVFDLTKKNVLTGPFFAQSQIGAVRSRGFEFEGQINITRDFRAIASFTQMEVKVIDDADAALIGKTPYVVPQQLASLAFDYTVRGTSFDGVTFGGGVRHIGSSYADAANLVEVPSATVFDAKIGYKKDNWAVNFNVTNLFDKAYVASCQTVLTCGYAEGRRFRLSSNVSW